MVLFNLRSKGSFYCLVFFLIVVLIVLTTIALIPTKNSKTNTTSVKNKNNNSSALCSSFPSKKGEVSCQDAVNVVLEKYPGKITKINKKTLSIPIGKPPAAIKFEAKAVWLISIIVNREFSFPKGGATKVLDFGVDVKEEKILITYPKFKK